MKIFLLAGLLAITGIASCTKKDDATPATPSLVGTWSLTSDNTVVTPIGGGTSYNIPNITTPGTVLSTYTADGKVVATNYSTATPSITTGTYTYLGTTITYLNASGIVTSTSEVSVLTATDLTLIANQQDSQKTYVRTSSFKRQ